MTIDEIIKELNKAKKHGLEGNTKVKTEIRIWIEDQSMQVVGDVDCIDFDDKNVYISTEV